MESYDIYKLFHFEDFTLTHLRGIMNEKHKEFIIDTRYTPEPHIKLNDLLYAPDWNNKDEMVIYIITDIEYTHNKITKVKVVKRTDYLFGNIINSPE